MTALEQPTLAKWNTLGTNDAYFNTQIGANFSSGTTSTVWWEELGRTTLGSAGDTISVASFAARKFLRVIYSVSASGGTINTRMTFNNDTGTNYAWMELANLINYSNNVTQASLAPTTAANSAERYGEIFLQNVSTRRKIFNGFEVDDNAASSSTSSNNKFYFGKWDNTAAQITRADLINIGTGDFAIGSEVIVLGHD